MTSKAINYLPLNLQSRVDLFLTQNGLKSNSAIILRKPSCHFKLESYLIKNNLSYSIDSRDSQLYFVSKNQADVNLLKSIWHQKDIESEVQKGLLLGYPNKAVSAFAKYKDHPERGKYLSGTLSSDFPKSQLNYWPYIGYVLRKGHEIEDSLIAQKWAQFIRQNNPTLAIWYEKEMGRILLKIRK